MINESVAIWRLEEPSCLLEETTLEVWSGKEHEFDLSYPLINCQHQHICVQFI